MAENNATNYNATYVGENELVTTRIFDAPRDLVFEAWTTPEHLSQVVGAEGLYKYFSRV